MTDDTPLVSRRTALKGLATFAGTGVVGAGTIIHASEPAAAVNHHVEIDDITIELSAEADESVGLAEIGLSDLWFEAQWENIENSVYAMFSFISGVVGVTLATVDLGVDGSGTETFGYGQTYEDSYTVDLDGPSYLDGATPMHVDPIDTNGQMFLDRFGLSPSESEKTREVRFGLTLWLANDDGSRDQAGLLQNAESYFNVTSQRVLPDAEAGDGEADAYGERE